MTPSLTQLPVHVDARAEDVAAVLATVRGEYGEAVAAGDVAHSELLGVAHASGSGREETGYSNVTIVKSLKLHCLICVT